MKKVSVIVPVYNAERTLTACLANLVHQTLAEIELILINDASVDGSRKILQDCKDQFPDKVVLIDMEYNAGPGGARNRGLDIATGQYIGFADSDDVVDTRMYQLLYEKAQEADYDIVDTGFLDVKNDRAIVYTGDDCTGILDDEKRSRLIAEGGYLWSKIIRRTLFEEPRKLREREHVILEDSEILTYLLATAKSIANVKEILYRYNYDEGSISHGMKDPERYCYNLYEAMRAVYDTTHTLANYEGIRDAVEYEILQMYSYGVNMCYQTKETHTYPGADEMLKKLATLRKETVRLKKYEDNPYVRTKIPAADIRLMKEADRR